MRKKYIMFFKEHAYDDYQRYQLKYQLKSSTTALVCHQCQKTVKSDNGDGLTLHLGEMVITTLN